MVPFGNHVIRLFLVLFFSQSVCAQEQVTQKNESNPTQQQIHFFESKIRPLLIDRCIDCHSDDEPESGLSLESRAAILRGGDLGPAVIPGKPKDSLLISAINHDEFLKMPPKEKLSTVNVVDLTKWVQMGAPWPDSKKADRTTSKPNAKANELIAFTDEQKSHWAFQPLLQPTLPKVKNLSWILSPIDLFVLEKLEANGLVAATDSDRATWIRRATYDLIGLPPTRDEVLAFVNDQSNDAYAKVIDRLLASPRYGEKWGRHWLDVARFADSNGLDENISYANAYRYRDYVIRSFNLDKPFDQFVEEQIAGDLLAKPKGLPQNLEEFDPYVATGFLAIGPKMLAEDDPMKMQMDIIDEQISTMGQAFMAMTLGCARCHDHKFDPIPTDDYYSLAGIFKSSKTMENHKVVAVWYERPLLYEELQKQIKKFESKIAASHRELDELTNRVKSEVRNSIQKNLAEILLTANAIELFDQSSAAAVKKGMTQQAEPFQVKNGYALIEAEAFHRGTLARVLDNYGKDIGIAGSSGAANGEYDISVQHAGKYAVEIRYAAQDSRPFDLVLNGKQVATRIGGKQTGTWYPDSQTWFVEAEINLPAGKSVLKLDSKHVFPHVDKIALVYKTDKPWPFGNEPYSITTVKQNQAHETKLSDNVPPVVIEKLSQFISKVKDGKQKDQKLLEDWITVTNAHRTFHKWFDGTKAEKKSEFGRYFAVWIHSENAKQLHPVIRSDLESAKPKNLQEIAAVFASIIRRATSNEKNVNEQLKGIASPLKKDGHPLVGPDKDLSAYFDHEQKSKADKLKSRIESLNKDKPKPKVAMGVTEAKPENIKVHLRGSHIVLGKTVPRRFLKIIDGDHRREVGNDRSGRLDLARWITNPKNPLTSRVIVNRVWHWHFGRGIVSSVDNFGLLGEKT